MKKNPRAGKQRAVRVAMLIAVIVITAFAIVQSVPSSHILPPNPAIAAPRDLPAIHNAFDLAPCTLNELLALPVDQFDKVDIARMNLLCATGLPGAEKLDVDDALATLDQWAQRVAVETERHLYRVTDPRYSEHYHFSEAYFRAEMLMQVLCQDLGVKYDMETVGDFSFRDSRVAFIHGMIPAKGQTIAETPGGTCASMPVLAVAVGRRLGYPLKLITTEAHIFVRWDGADDSNPHFRERFNIETTNGFNSFDDDYYKTWPRQLTDEQVRTNGYLKSLTPSEEFAQFLASRGHCALDNGLTDFAARCYENAYRYDTKRPSYLAWFVDAAARSDYQPATPTLIGLLAQKRHTASTHQPFEGAIPSSSHTTGLQPITPRVPQLMPLAPSLNPPVQPESPFRSQP